MSLSLALLRIEHKLDLLLHSRKGSDAVLREMLESAHGELMDSNGDLCPVCNHAISITIDPGGEAYSRTCGCRAPVPLVPGISALTRPREQTSPNSIHLNPDAEQASSSESSPAEDASTRASSRPATS